MSDESTRLALDQMRQSATDMIEALNQIQVQTTDAAKMLELARSILRREHEILQDVKQLTTLIGKGLEK